MAIRLRFVRRMDLVPLIILLLNNPLCTNYFPMKPSECISRIRYPIKNQPINPIHKQLQ